LEIDCLLCHNCRFIIKINYW